MHEKISGLLTRLDSFTYNHSVRTMTIATEVENYLSMDNHELSIAALLHDVGKIYIAPSILDKKGRLNTIERELVDLHSYVGYMMLRDMKVNERISRIVLYHHGFQPVALSKVGSYIEYDVLEKADILHAIDVFEALTSDRPYHRGLPSKEALSEMKEKRFHKKTLDYFEMVISEERNSAVRRHFNENEAMIENTIESLYAVNAS